MKLRVTNYEFLKISFIDKNELNKKLPVEIFPKPDMFHRVHLLLTPLEKQLQASQRQPNLQQIAREGFTIVELGAVANVDMEGIR